jgi:cytosine/adenosine deaminase-related metal-dependent hydrolase
MTQNETQRLAASGAVAGLCPITEANLGDGYFPGVEFRAAGGAFGIGTDSNVAISASEELRMLEYGQRLQLRARNLLAGSDKSTGRVLFEVAVTSGARALGVAGGIALGAPADVISLNVDHVSCIGRERDQLLDSWIFAAAQGCIDGVWRGGVKLVSAGQHREREAIGARYRSVLEALLRA